MKAKENLHSFEDAYSHIFVVLHPFFMIGYKLKQALLKAL